MQHCSPTLWRSLRSRPDGTRSASSPTSRRHAVCTRIVIAAPILPHIANFDDFDPLAAEPAVDLVQVRPPTALPGNADLIILPGSKATIPDLVALRAAGFDI